MPKAIGNLTKPVSPAKNRQEEFAQGDFA